MTLHIVDEIAEVIVNRLRWSPYNTGFDVFRDRDVNFTREIHLPCIDVRVGQESPWSGGKLGAYSAEVEMHLDCYSESRDLASRDLLELRALSTLALMATKPARLLMDSRVHGVFPIGASEIKVGDGSASKAIGTYRTSYLVRYAIDITSVNEATPASPVPDLLPTVSLVGSSPFAIAAGGAWTVQLAAPGLVLPQLVFVVLLASATAPMPQQVFDGVDGDNLPALQVGGSIDAASVAGNSGAYLTNPGDYKVYGAANTAGRLCSVVASAAFTLTA